MEHLFWYFVGGGLLIGYLYSVLWCTFDGVTDEWWGPWVLGAAVPFLLVYEKRMEIGFGAALLAALVLFFILVCYLGRFCDWIWGML